MHPMLRSFCEAEGIAIVDGPLFESRAMSFRWWCTPEDGDFPEEEEEVVGSLRSKLERAHWVHGFQTVHTDSSLTVAPIRRGGHVWTLNCWAKQRRDEPDLVRFRAETERRGLVVWSLTREQIARVWAAVDGAGNEPAGN